VDDQAANARDTGIVGAKEVTIEELKAKGAFGFPQSKAETLCDSSELRFSVWSNSKYLCAQAILWEDGDDSLGTYKDGRKIGDWSELMLDLDADGQLTPRVDGSYCLNPWPNLPGLRCQTVVSSKGVRTLLRDDSRGRGSIQYVQTYSEKRVRVDTYLIPLREIGQKLDKKIRICYWANSEKPKFTVTSADYEHSKPSFYARHVPHDKYHEFVLTDGGAMDIRNIPRGRSK
jgi:hypothetical protein